MLFSTAIAFVVSGAGQAAPAVAPVAPTVTGDSLTPLYYLVGALVLAQVGPLVFGVIKWSFARNLAREEQDKKKHSDTLEELQDDFAEYKRANEKAFDQLVNTVHTVQNELAAVAKSVSGVGSAVEGVRGSVNTILDTTDKRIAEQSSHYQRVNKELLAEFTKKLEEHTVNARYETTRAMSDAVNLASKEIEKKRKR